MTMTSSYLLASSRLELLIMSNTGSAEKKRTDLCHVFNLILYFSIKPWKTEIYFVPLFERILPFDARRTNQCQSNSHIQYSSTALLTTP